MTRSELAIWAKAFAADLGSNDARVPFDRVVRKHLAGLEALLAGGLTFTTIATAISRAGGARPNAGLYTDKHLWTALRRARARPQLEKRLRSAPSRSEKRPSPLRGEPAVAPARRIVAGDGESASPPSSPRVKAGQSHQRLENPRNTDSSGDLSNEDILAALDRVRRADS